MDRAAGWGREYGGTFLVLRDRIVVLLALIPLLCSIFTSGLKKWLVSLVHKYRILGQAVKAIMGSVD